MITFLIVLTIGLLLISGSTVYLLGFRTGGEHWQHELQRVHDQSLTGQRQIHDLTRQAFVAMAEAVECQRRLRP